MSEFAMWFTPEQAETLGSSDPVVRAMIDLYIARHEHNEQIKFGQEVLATLDALPVVWEIDTTAETTLWS